MAAFAEPARVTVDEATLAYRRAGAGPPVLLVHGIPTSSRLWDLVAPQLVPEADVVAVDMLGFGESDKPLDRDVSVTAQARLVPGVLDALRIERATVVGHDLGGAVAQILAVEAPARVTALGLIDSVSFDSWPIRRMRAIAELAPALARLPGGSVLRSLEAALARELPEGPAREALAAGIRAWGGDPRPFLHAARAMDPSHTMAVAARLGELAVPAHVVWGASDPFQGPEWAPRLRDAIPGATLRMLDAGHFPPWERPTEVAAEIRALLDRAGA